MPFRFLFQIAQGLVRRMPIGQPNSAEGRKRLFSQLHKTMILSIN